MYVYVAKSLVISSFVVPEQPQQAYGGMYLKAKCSVDGQIYARCLAKYLQTRETRGTLAIINLDRGQAGVVALGPTIGPCDASCLNTCI